MDMFEQIPIMVGRGISHADHLEYERIVQETMELIKPEYIEWLKFNRRPIIVDDSIKYSGCFDLVTQCIHLSQSFINATDAARIAVLEEEITHMIDWHLKFSKQPDYQTASEVDSEELLTKTALALTRVWDELGKDMPTGEHYSDKAHTAIEMLPEVLACNKMLRDLYEIEGEQERVMTYYNKLEESSSFTFRSSDDAFNTFFNYVLSLVFGLNDVSDDQFHEHMERIVTHQREQVSEVMDHVEAIIFNPDQLSAEEMSARIFTHLHPHCEKFDRMAKGIGQMFKDYPDWKQAIKSEDTSRLSEIMEQGITQEAMQFMRQHATTYEAKRVLDATEMMFMLANAKDGNTVPQDACIGAKVNGKTAMQIAVAAEAYEFASLLKAAQNQRETGNQHG